MIDAVSPGFVQWYDHARKHSGLKFVTPQQRHQGVADKTLARRREVYEQAKAAQSCALVGRGAQLVLAEAVWLNPERELSVSANAAA